MAAILHGFCVDFFYNDFVKTLSLHVSDIYVQCRMNLPLCHLFTIQICISFSFAVCPSLLFSFFLCFVVVVLAIWFSDFC